MFTPQFILPSTIVSLPGTYAENHPHSMMLPPPCFMVGMVWLWRVRCLVSAKHGIYSLMAKRLHFSLSHVYHMPDVHATWTILKIKRCSSNSGFLFVTSDWWSTLLTVVVCRVSLSSGAEAFNSFRIVTDVLVACITTTEVSLSKALKPNHVSGTAQWPADETMVIVSSFQVWKCTCVNEIRAVIKRKKERKVHSSQWTLTE